MSDIQEARAAIVAVREACPDALVICSMTYDANHRTLTGTDPVTATLILESLGADIVASNCGTGPEDMLDVVVKMNETTSLPVAVLPNAGMPELVDGRTTYRMTPAVFADRMEKMADAGASLLGGCCGTTPEFIRLMVERLGRKAPAGSHMDQAKAGRTTVLAGRGAILRIGPDYPVRLVGERINPTAQKSIAAELKAGKLTELKKEGLAQAEHGADALDVNCGVPGLSEETVLPEALMALQNVVNVPLVLDSSNPLAVENGLKAYAGRLLVNSVNAKKGSFDRLLPLVKRYGAAVILLPLDAKGIPETAAERMKIVRFLLDEALKAGLSPRDLLVDGLVMTVGTSQRYVLETVETIRLAKKEFGLNSVLGVSNVSFGLPRRPQINTAFLSMAIAGGLDAGILNPLSEDVHRTLSAGSVLTNRDRNAVHYIERYSSPEKAEARPATDGDAPLDRRIAEAVTRGHKDAVKDLLSAAMAQGTKADEIIRDILIPAITRVGDLYENGTYFLPQLIMSAETMQEAIRVLQPFLASGSSQADKPVVVLATVKGDVHDIGKRIVSLMLSNNGFTVVDLGKDVDCAVILDRCRKENAALLGLSALMTTTMPEMQKAAELMKKQRLSIPIMVGGAAVNEEFARRIGGHYARDAASAVRLAKKLLKDAGK
jgi:5-methyltetrahydrofolate--homocysteine methyltransferase